VEDIRQHAFRLKCHVGDDTPSELETEDHRLEAGGFDSRLKARLLLDPEKTGDLDSLLRRPPNSSASAVNQAPSKRTGSGRLEGEGF
jgi:hypothetical protein